MGAEKIALLSYQEVLEKVKNIEAHLLLGNGFNMGLGVDTSYSAIFKKMMEDNHGIYRDAQYLVQQPDCDLEKFIGKLSGDIRDENIFLKKYVKNKIKHDFMRAAHKIVKSEIKNIYAEKNNGIFMLLQNFTNYFTLNYDSFLYLLLLNFKSGENEETRTIAIQPSLKFIEEDMNLIQNNICAEIKELRNNGIVDIKINDTVEAHQLMSTLTKKNFISEIEIYSEDKNKNWKKSGIEKVVKIIFKEEQKNKVLEKIDDGSRQKTLFGVKDYVFDFDQETQNLFFLHGAFHIYKDGNKEKKITQTSDKPLYSKLEEILNNNDKDIICVFQDGNKIDEINKSRYLTKSYNKLFELLGCMVIIGCSLSENDNHIYEQINRSKIDTLYISSEEGGKKNDFDKAKNIFKNKQIILFDKDTISYALPN